MSQDSRVLDRGRFMRFYAGGGGPGAMATIPIPGIRRFAWTGAADIERHLQFGDDENHLEAKVPTYTGEVQVEDGDNLTEFLKYALGNTSIIEVSLEDLNASRPWLWVNVMDRRRTVIRHSTVVKQATWNSLPNEYDVDDVNIMSFGYESPHCWKVRGYAIMGEEFDGNGIDDTFVLAETAIPLSTGAYAFVVMVESDCEPGTMIELEEGYTVSDTELSFDDPPADGLSIQVIYPYFAGCVPGAS